jgi:uncharacterized protein (TIGR03435 family)
MKEVTTSGTGRRAIKWSYVGTFALLSVTPFIFICSQVLAQSAPADWEKAGGGKMAFEVVSVKLNKSGLPQPGGRNMPTSNIPLNDGDDYSSTGGLFSATNTPLSAYMAFAYKLTISQDRLLVPQLPKWATADRFDIEARAQGNPTRDQMRLMMQSVLADRFKLAVHFETRQIPVYELILAKSNTLGSQLRPHSEDPPCPADSPSGPPGDSGVTVAGGFPTRCGNFMPLSASVPGRQRMGARNLPWGIFVNFVGPMGRVADRPVVDRTGLGGTVDFVLEWTPGAPSTPDFQPDLSGPTFLEALQDQLGLKLSSEVDPVQFLVIDHVEEPSAN